MYFNILR